VNVASKLQQSFSGSLDISFSGGVDVFNIEKVFQSGLYPVTVCTDLLKPGGYGRLAQNIDRIRDQRIEKESKNVFLKQYAEEVLNDPYYKKEGLKAISIKTGKPLGLFDCAFAPCEETCPTNQDIPSYMYHTARGEFDQALEVILKTNPFARSTGMICDHICQNKCTRINYDNALQIRDIKHFNAEKGSIQKQISKSLSSGHKQKVSIIGAGPAGLTCAYFLKKSGFEVRIFETKTQAGGMVSAAVPKFRLTDEAVDLDIDFIKQTGVEILYGQKITKEKFEELQKECDAIFIAAGAQDAYKLSVTGSDKVGVLNPLDFLYKVKSGSTSDIGQRVVVIGGGNTAMDAARTAYRLCGKNGKVTLVYRRTIKQMPAEYKEIKDTLDEGIELIDLASPIEVISENGKVKALRCIRMKLSEKGADGRSLPIEIPGTEFDVPCDTIIPALGQSLAIDFIEKDVLRTNGNSYETKLENVFIGGDALRGAATLIKAVGDGRKAAEEIIHKYSDPDQENETSIKTKRQPESVESLMLKKSKRQFGEHIQERALDDRLHFQPVSKGLTMEQAVEEAKRCLLCDEVCNICTTLCPNLALQYYIAPKVAYNLQKVTEGVLEEDSLFKIQQSAQIIHVADWCNQCGNCETFCPTNDAPYKVKPHLYLDRTKFDADHEGYFYEAHTGTLYGKEAGKLFSLKEDFKHWVWECGNFNALLDHKDFSIIEFFGPSQSQQDFRRAAEMSIIIKGAKMFIGYKKSLMSE
jgi:putative selenate reductase